MKIDITVESPVYESYRAARVRSLFNVSESQGSSHRINVDFPIDEKDWSLGVIVGPSGSGKTTIGTRLFDGAAFHRGFDWDESKPIIDQIGDDFNKATGALSAVGLGSVPSWLRPFQALSMGEKFRAEMARIVVEKPSTIIVDEFTSVVDRQIAQVGAGAFAKAWRRTKGKCILLSCHYDILDWLQPDWVLDTKYWEFTWGYLSPKPTIELDIYEANSAKAWPFFKPHHYLDLPNPIAPTYYIGEVGGEAVAHLAVTTLAGLKQARLTRLVVMPEWQGAGVGMKFLEYVAQHWLDGLNRYGKKMPGIIHTSHPGLIFALQRSPKWRLTSQQMGGVNKAKMRANYNESGRKAKAKGKTKTAAGSDFKFTGCTGYGGHLRAVAGFKYVGEAGKCQS
jgi:GNAT superfamily N-acetyltransferase